MRKLMLAGVALCAIAGAGLAGCSDTAVMKTNAVLDKYDHALDNFNVIAARVDQSVAKTSATVGPHCAGAEDTGKQLGRIVKGNDTALKALNGITAALSSFCTSLPQNTDAAIVALAKAIADGQAALKGA
jgi:hypothetical protein